MDFRLAPNQSENGNDNKNLDWLNKIFRKYFSACTWIAIDDRLYMSCFGEIFISFYAWWKETNIYEETRE